MLRDIRMIFKDEYNKKPSQTDQTVQTVETGWTYQTTKTGNKDYLDETL